jgi:hypothetical protein
VGFVIGETRHITTHFNAISFNTQRAWDRGI